MNTKVKTWASALLAAATLNAASAEVPAVNGNVGAKYASDYHRRGEILSEEALQAQLGFNIAVGSVGMFGDLFTNQNTESAGNDTNEVTIGLNTSLFEDSVNAYLGVYNTDTGVGEDDLEAFASIGFNTFLSPAVSVYRDTDNSFYTYEGQVSYDIDLDVVGLEVAGIVGNTDTSAAADTTYVGAKLTASRTFKDNINVYADVALSDTDSRDNETVWGLGLRVKF